MSRLLADTGRALYGERWQSEIARALGVSDRTVRRWVAGDDDPRPGVYVDLLRHVVDRIVDLHEVEERLKRARS
jgi:predicted transcriptional regulator